MVKKKAQGITYYCLILDESGSMGHLTNDVKQLYVKKIQMLRQESQKHNQNIIGGCIKFSYSPEVVCWHSDLETMGDSQQISNYNPHGQTALFDAVGDAISRLQKYNLNSNDAVLMEVLTDGQENYSGNFNAYSLKRMMENCEKTLQWTFVFQLPIGYKQNFIRQFDISDDNIQEWETTQRGLQEIVQLTSLGTSNYMAARSQGHTQTQCFYQDVNLDKLSTKDIQKNLTDLSANFKVIKVNKEFRVDEFVEQKLHRNLVEGSIYYQLTKPELLRKGRQLLIMEKDKTTIWGGDEAYDLLQLPKNANVKVNPKNLSKYDLFLESRSNNRKLVRGSKVLFDKTKKLGEIPTWQI